MNQLSIRFQCSQSNPGNPNYLTPILTISQANVNDKSNCKNPPGNPEPGATPGRSRRCNRGRRRPKAIGWPLPGTYEKPGGKAGFLRLIPEPEDLPGGCFVSKATPDGKGSSIRAMGLLFLLVFSFWFSVGAHLRVRPLKGGHMGPPLQELGIGGTPAPPVP